MIVIKQAVRLAVAGVLLAPLTAAAQSAPTGAPPPEAKALVEGPKKGAEVPTIEDKTDGTTASLASGGMWSTGNSRQLAATANGAFETRWSNNGIGANLLGNYGEGAPPGGPTRVTAQNVQGRARYDRFVLANASVFLINTGRHDRFQGLDFRYNLDPGFRYLFLKESTNTLWVEAGYDLQHDIRRNADRVVLDANKVPVVDPAGNPVMLPKTQTDHSLRLFLGFKHAFNEQVTLATGVEYLQSVIETERSRVNFDALFAAKVGGGLAVGVGFTARYDNAPLPGKQNLDTATTLSLIYAFSDAAPPAEPTCICPPPPPEPAPVREPSPSPPPPLPPPVSVPPAEPSAPPADTP